jgi:hypothetical protein
VSDRLELVQDFDAIRPGDRVKIFGCEWCGAPHQFIVTRKLVNRPGIDPGGTVGRNTVWIGWPPPSCDSRGLPPAFDRDAVARRCVFLVLPPEAETERAAEHERTRERVR